MSTPDTLRWWAEQFRTRTSEFYTSHVLVADLNYAADEIESLEAENKKLRELVSDMWRFTGAACKKYPRLFDPVAAGGQTVQLNAIDAFEQRMHELGIEVD